MTLRALAWIGIVAVCSALGAGASTQDGQTRVFRATTVSVAVNVSVKRGNRVVTNLTANDFRLTDNGVAQTIDSVSRESVPIDVTLFLDTSASTAGKLDDMKQDVQGIVRLLRPGDRFRLLTIGDSVYETVPWVPAGTKLDLSFDAVGGISLDPGRARDGPFPSARSRSAASRRRPDGPA